VVERAKHAKETSGTNAAKPTSKAQRQLRLFRLDAEPIATLLLSAACLKAGSFSLGSILQKQIQCFGCNKHPRYPRWATT
jgi:hypothetical protein